MGKNKNRNRRNQSIKAEVLLNPNETTVVRMGADFSGSGGVYTPMFSSYYNGEKNLGAIGPIKNYRPNYEALRLRSWQSYYESEVSHTIVNSYIKWVIGKGLKLQCEPLVEVLNQEGIELDRQSFCKSVEARYIAWSKSSMSDYSGMKSKNELSAIAFKNADLGGDVLVILRYINNCVKLQLIDASHIISPNTGGSEMFPQVLSNGNKILNGIEFSPSGEHIAFYVRDCNLSFERIEAKNSLGLTCAFIYYGSEYRLDNVRGVPKLSSVLEKIASLERYASATLGSAEERQKIAYVMEPELMATPQNPLQSNMVKAHDYYKGSSQIPVTAEGKEIANTIAVSTQKQTFLMPPGIKMKSIESKQELFFKEFHTTYVELICACLGIPSNVAMMLYTESFSASRAALKDWEHTLHVTRNYFSTGFEQYIFNFWLETEILKNKIQAPGYLKAKISGNYMVLEAYRSVRFVGAPVPHIDPLKEVQAERLKLGAAAASYPLTTAEAATENLNGGESAANVQQFSEEIDMMRKLKIETPNTPKVLKKKTPQ